MEDCQPPVPSLPLEGETPLDAAPLRTDTLADSVFMLLALTVLQRTVGFVRELFFCRWLDAEQLGQWDMAFGFLMLAGPLAVLSLPGTFGRYVERYRQQGQLRWFLRYTGTSCGVLAAASVAALYIVPQRFSQLVFGSPDHVRMIWLLGATLLAVILFNYLISLFTALRNIRLVAGMELANSLMFAGLSLGMMVAWDDTAFAAAAGYGAACLATSLGGSWWLARALRRLPRHSPSGTQTDLWARVLPFAAWIMAINLLTNLFDIAGRYMIVHYSACSPAEALAEVGNYRSSRVAPLLLASITAMIATVITPHLSHDWEAGRRHRVSMRLNLLLKVWTLLLTAGAVMVLWAAPLLFQVAFRGKFAGGLEVLPWTLVYCTWFGLATIAQRYVWCAEKAGLAGLALGIGLAVNVGLSALLLPRIGLLGAVLATAAGNAAALAAIMALGRRLGFAIHRATWFMLGLPLAVCLGPTIATLCLAAALFEAIVSERVFSAEEKHELFAGAMQYVDRLRRWRQDGSHWTAVGG
jgi:polysaccharide transporter, PST family